VAFQVTDVINRHGPVWKQLNDMPKIELHRHLEGAIRLETLVDVGAQYGIELPSYDPEELRPHVQMMPDDPANTQAFLSKFTTLRRFFVSEEVIRRVARESVEDAAADNIRYMELRFTPYAEAKLKKFPLLSVIDWITDEAQRAAQENDIKVKFIIAMNRHEPVTVGQAMVDAALNFVDRGVAGIDLCGNEISHAAEPFGHIFQQAKDAGLGLTIHAGEWMGPENVVDAIKNHHTRRIGHGVRVVEDSDAVQYALDKQVYFEVCPTSNLQSGVVPALEYHPLRDLAYLETKVTLNTDDPAISNITLTDEYALAVEGLDMSMEFIVNCIFNAVEAAFLPDDEKNALEAEFRAGLGLDVTKLER
jgi:adenosine deaminase